MTDTHPLYSAASIHDIEQAALRSLPPFTLMRRAGQATASLALELLANSGNAQSVLVLAGPGNNGGDALEVAALLAENNHQVTVLLTADPADLPSDARQAYEHAAANDVVFIDSKRVDDVIRTEWALIVDGLFGIGLKRAISGDLRQLIEKINARPTLVLALDVPSGLDVDTGAIIGAESGIAIRATHTITFIGDKPGLHTCDGRDHAGKIRVAHLDIAPDLFAPASMELSGIASFAHALRMRQHSSHKGSYGDVVVLGGASGMVGAAILSARTAAKCGAGRVFIASIAADLVYDNLQPELMCRAASDIDFKNRTTIAGPGMGTSREAHDLLVKAIAADAPLALDADALNLLAEEPALQQKLRLHHAPVLLTPHPLEAARLLGMTATEIQADRIAAARKLAAMFNATIVLKGSGSIIAAPNGRLAINPSGNPALATAGSGDVLSGVCGALLAQHWPAWEAALAAVWLHGAAADELVKCGVGPIGLVASELIPQIRTLLNHLVREYAGKPPY